MQGNLQVARDPVIQKLVRWGKDHSSARAMLLTSTRAIPDAQLDLFSDYDLILVVLDVAPYYESRTWLDEIGPVLVVYQDPLKPYFGFEKFAYITQYEHGLKIDFTIWPVEILHQVALAPTLPDDLDLGYLVLLDKDDLTSKLKPPTFRAYSPTPPDDDLFSRVIEEFFHETTYVAKLLWRDELLPVKYSLDNVMKLNYLRQMLEWQIGLEHDWDVKSGALGKGLRQNLNPAVWSELKSTYTGADLEENWTALFTTIALFRKVALQVGEQLGYEYPNELDERMMNYLQKVKNLDAGAESFLPGGADG
jgi:aminoglycoside 6-adenylyltransferase